MTRELSKIIHRQRQRLKGKYKYRKTARRIRNVISCADLPFGAALMLAGEEMGHPIGWPNQSLLVAGPLHEKYFSVQCKNGSSFAAFPYQLQLR